MAAADDKKDNESCAICLDPMTENLWPTSHSQCGHVFHGNCIVDSLRRDSRCPIFRDTPNQRDDDDSLYYDHDYERDQPKHIRFCDALKQAMVASKSDKKIAKRVLTINPSSCLDPLHIPPDTERVVRAHGGLGDRRWAWLVSNRCIGLGPCVKCRLGLRYQPARALQWTYRQEV